MNKKTWLMHTTVVCVLIVIMMLMAVIMGYFGLRDEWMRNDGWSHRPFVEYKEHQDFFGDLLMSGMFGCFFIAVYWLLSFVSFLVVNYWQKWRSCRKGSHGACLRKKGI